VAWQKLAEIVGEFVSKGSRVYVEGKLQTSEWKGRLSGEKKYRTEIVARDLVFWGRERKETESRGLVQMRLRNSSQRTHSALQLLRFRTPTCRSKV
jgi:single stranded DNA-binding protein